MAQLRFQHAHLQSSIDCLGQDAGLAAMQHGIASRVSAVAIVRAFLSAKIKHQEGALGDELRRAQLV